MTIGKLEFEQVYIKLRKSEGRLYSDAEVALLPEVAKGHTHFKEWKVRKDSLMRLLNYLSQSGSVKNILEIGCGNGWLCNRLAQSGFDVTGFDINQTELEQAKRVFPEINFFYKDIFNSRSEEKFDVVLFAASLQYFRNVNEVILLSMKEFLNENGCVIIADTKFYTQTECLKAEKRSKLYFEENNSEMSEYYFHHSLDGLNQFEVKVLKPENTFVKLISGFKNPFNIYIVKLKPQFIESNLQL